MSQNSSKDTKTDNFARTHQLRIGLEIVNDFTPAVPYTFKNSVIVGVARREKMLNLNADVEIWPRLPALRAQARLGYHEQAFNKGNQSSLLLINWVEAGINERVTYNYFHVALGLRMDFLAKARMSPYTDLQFLLALPTQVRYELLALNSSFGLPDYRLVEKGGRPGPGWRMSAGLRAKVAHRIAFSLGVYYVEQDMRIKWPHFVERDFDNTLLRLQNTGVNAVVQFCW